MTQTDELPQETVDAAVIGAGPAGLSGAVALTRSRRSVVVIDNGDPRNAPADGVHALLGREGIAPFELQALGREEVRGYGGRVAQGTVASVLPGDPDGEEPFTVGLDDGRVVRARRLLVATGVRDILPAIPGLAENWGRGVVHCPYCHGWEVREQPIGILATTPGSVHQALLFRQLSDDVVFYAAGMDLDADTRARFAARGIRIVDAPVAAIEFNTEGITGVRLADGSIEARRAIAVASVVEPRLTGLDGIALPVEDLPGGAGRRVLSGLAGVTAVTGVWVAGNVTDPFAQVGASAAAGVMAGAHINADLIAGETDRALRDLDSAAA